MPLTERDIDALLYQAESETLDFKREQYRFYGNATDAKKSELLKDVLAFANAWRGDREALILIGVEERPGRPAVVIGVPTTDHLKDADLQQFVNQKTNRPVVFSYESAEYRGLSVGCLRIPAQTRPLFATKKYGLVEADKVYVRRGSSTDTADPDEVTQMCEARITARSPRVQIRLADAESHDVLDPLRVEIVRTVGELPVWNIADPEPARDAWSFASSFDRPFPRKQFLEEFADYVADMRALARLRFAAVNESSVKATDVRAELLIAPSNPGMRVLDRAPHPPRRRQSDISWQIDTVGNVFDQQSARTVELEQRGPRRLIKVNMRTINPGAAVSTEDILLVGGVPGTLRLRGQLTCSETMPLDVDMVLEVVSRDARLTLKELLLEESSIYGSD